MQFTRVDGCYKISVTDGNAYKMLFRKPEGKKPLGGLGVDGTIILK
jgi:hypothetical protein